MDRDRNRDREKGERGGLYNIKFMSGSLRTSLREFPSGLHKKKKPINNSMII
jgi:hypothetical protein